MFCLKINGQTHTHLQKKILEKNGYDEPSVSNLCFDQSHSNHCYVVKEEDVRPACENVPKVKRYYLPISSKIKNEEEVPVTVMCRNCGTPKAVLPIFVYGDPRNIGLIGHWDGWQPNSGRPGSHSSGLFYVNTDYKHLYTLNKPK